MQKEILDKLFAHAEEEAPRESCGLIAIVKGRERYFPCKNLSPDNDQFILDPLDYVRVENIGEIVAICHSHPVTAAVASEADKIGCEQSNLPWYITNPFTRQWSMIEPCGFKAPLIGRQWVWGITDCWSLTRDWFMENGISLPDWERPLTYMEFERTPFFDDCWKEAGFFQIDKSEIQYGDAILMTIESSKINHVGVYVGDQMLLHHIRGRLSSRDCYGEWLQGTTARALRHRDWQQLRQQ